MAGRLSRALAWTAAVHLARQEALAADPGAEEKQDIASATPSGARSPRDNTTTGVLCRALRLSELDMSADDFETSAMLDEEENIAYLRNLEDEGKRFSDRISAEADFAKTPRFVREMADLRTKGGIPKIFRMNGWDKFCDQMQDKLGTTYSLEHWFRQMLENLPGVVTDYNVADFVVLPLCPTASMIYLQAKMYKEGVWEPNKMKYLLHQGRLAEWPVVMTEATYLQASVNQYDCQSTEKTQVNLTRS
eukprot:TRINITY_DN16449_c0_g1_i1.p2 TRINITY_DN16449_c0_g1~~TRINITY_DN16449_c0_g1_i1.p2  ORF type:complete len:248 (-),score=38.41 TRINITY_DN16449_c0_g1_i1:979-1722(-)